MPIDKTQEKKDEAVKWEQIKKIAEMRTKGDWRLDYRGKHGDDYPPEPAIIAIETEFSPRAYEIYVDHRRDYTDPEPNTRFIAATANNFDRIAAVVDAAKAFREMGYIRPMMIGGMEFISALEEIEK